MIVTGGKTRLPTLNKSSEDILHGSEGSMGMRVYKSIAAYEWAVC